MARAINMLPSLGRPKKKAAAQTDVVCRGTILELTQEQMAQKMECSVSSVRDMEQKGRLPGSHALKNNFSRLARLAGISSKAELKEKNPDD